LSKIQGHDAVAFTIQSLLFYVQEILFARVKIIIFLDSVTRYSSAVHDAVAFLTGLELFAEIYHL